MKPLRTIYVERETEELFPVPVTKDDVVVTAAVEFCIVADGERPVTWVAAQVLSGKTYALASSLTAGRYHVFAKVTDSPEIPVIHAGDVVAR